MAFIHAVLAIVNVPFVTAYFTKSVPRQIVDQGRSAKRIAEISSHLGRYYHLGTILPRTNPKTAAIKTFPLESSSLDVSDYDGRIISAG